MKRILTVVFLFHSVFSFSQLELNIGGGVNYYRLISEFGSLQRGDLAVFGRIVEVSGAWRESEDWYYRMTFQGVENVLATRTDLVLREYDKTRRRYLKVIPQVEYLPRNALGFTAGVYLGGLLEEEEIFAGSNLWRKIEEFPPTRKLDAGIMVGANLYLGSISIGLHYTRGVISLRENVQTSATSSFANVEQFNSGVQIKMGYFFSVGKNEWE